MNALVGAGSSRPEHGESGAGGYSDWVQECTGCSTDGYQGDRSRWWISQPRPRRIKYSPSATAISQSIQDRHSGGVWQTVSSVSCVLHKGLRTHFLKAQPDKFCWSLILCFFFCTSCPISVERLNDEQRQFSVNFLTE